MSPKQEHVERELLTIGFRTYPRGLANGFVFGVFTAVWMSAHLPMLFLVSWIFALGILQMTRLALSRAFLRRIQPAASFAAWTRLAAAGYGAVGFAWGVLGAAAIHFAFEEKIYILWVGFLITIFAVLQSQTTGNKPLILRSFVFGAGVPLLVISALEPIPNYWLRLVAELPQPKQK